MRQQHAPVFQTRLGRLYEGDCTRILRGFEDESVDTIFADPPFNLKKIYGSKSNDALTERQYLNWCKVWIGECARVLRNGGSMFIYNLPKWNIFIANYLNDLDLSFRHWIAVEQKNSLPISGRLYPSHYSLLYYSKGKPRVFRKIRTPIETCRHCGGELKDYGGHRKAMNPLGVNLKDIWTDIPPVRHRKFKSEKRTENALSTKLLDRVVEMSTVPGDLVLDPFGGSGTTFAVCEKKERKWIGIELEDTFPIRERLTAGSIAHHRNSDYVECSCDETAEGSKIAAE